MTRSGLSGAPAPTPRSTIFSGGGHRLGSDEVDSEFIPDLDAPGESSSLYAIYFSNGHAMQRRNRKLLFGISPSGVMGSLSRMVIS